MGRFFSPSTPAARMRRGKGFSARESSASSTTLSTVTTRASSSPNSKNSCPKNLPGSSHGGAFADEGSPPEKSPQQKKHCRGYGGPQTFSIKHTPDHGREPWRPDDSGSSATSRNRNVSRFNCGAVLSSERTATGFRPQVAKKRGPSLGANLNGAPARLSSPPSCFSSMRLTPGEVMSHTQWVKLATAARSRASERTSSGVR